MEIKTIKLKILEWDRMSGSFVIQFIPIGENIPNIPEESLPSYAYQPHSYGENLSVETVLKYICRSGHTLLEATLSAYELAHNDSINNKFQEYVGKEFDFLINDLYNDDIVRGIK